MDGDAGMKWELTILNRPVNCTVTPLDDGIHVLLTGGDKGHIGAGFPSVIPIKRRKP